MDLKNFTKEELQLINNKQVFLTKKNVLEKVELFLAKLPPLIDRTFENFDLTSYKAKISKGENYHNLPYRVLDFPANFTENKFLALRVMFIFGHGFSFHFIKTIKNKEITVEILSKFKTINTFINTHNSLWVHHYDNEFYRDLKHLSSDDLMKIIHSQKNIKISFFSQSLDFPKVESELSEFVESVKELW